jgi:arylsulfatase A-like enzyme
MQKCNIIWILGESVRNYPGSDKIPQNNEYKCGKYKLMEDIASEGIEFSNMVVSGPSTVMAHSSMFTSHPSVYLGRTYADFKFDTTIPTISSILKKNGYHIYTSTHYAEGRKILKPITQSLDPKDTPEDIKHDINWGSEDLIKVLDHLLKKGLEEPFFLMVNFNNQENTAELMGSAIAKLKEHNLYDNSLFFLSPDHGWPDLNRNPNDDQHDSVLTDSTSLIPFFMKFPGCSIKKIPQLTSTLDIMPTILDFLNIPRSKYKFHGQSLMPLISGKGGYKEIKHRTDIRYLFQIGRSISIRDENFKYLVHPSRPVEKREEFYHLNLDKDELKNISFDKKYNTKKLEFREEFKRQERNLINFHANILINKFKKQMPKNMKKAKILLFGSAHPLFLKILLKACETLDDCEIDFVGEKIPTSMENITFHNLTIEESDFSFIKKIELSDLQKAQNQSKRMIVKSRAIKYKDFIKNCSPLLTKYFDLTIVPIDNPYGVGQKEYRKIVKNLNTNNVVFFDYNLDVKIPPRNWFINGLSLLYHKRNYYISMPYKFPREVKRYIKSIREN